MKRFKKIYVEITSCCNLNCSFCGNTKRKKQELTIEEFTTIVEKIKPYTDYIYLHVKGEPLLHSKLDQILSICDRASLHVQITTNGTLLKDRYEILNRHECIRQINVSLHCEQKEKDYFENVFEVGRKLSTKMFLSYRLWTLKDLNLDPKSTEIVNKMISYYELSPDIVQKIFTERQIKIAMNTYLNKENEFVWPTEESSYYQEGYCHALSSQIAILVDGRMIPCCLDGEGKMVLGNIFEDDLEDVLKSKKFQEMLTGFRNNQSVEELCKHCNFKNRFLQSE